MFSCRVSAKLERLLFQAVRITVVLALKESLRAQRCFASRVAVLMLGLIKRRWLSPLVS